jgi:adenine phosphoribosyltransferase
MDAQSLRELIREVADFPEPGISFKDITTLLADPVGFSATIDALCAPFVDKGITYVVGIEARGFVFSAPVAHALGAGLIPIRKPGKLPAAVDSVSYDLEYGGGTLEIHTDALAHGSRVLIVDDILATGGTAAAAGELVRRQRAELVGYAFLAELGFLGGRARLEPDVEIHALIDYEA